MRELQLPRRPPCIAHVDANQVSFLSFRGGLLEHGQIAAQAHPVKDLARVRDLPPHPMENQEIVLLHRPADVHEAGLIVESGCLRQHLHDVLVGAPVDHQAERAPGPVLADQHNGLPEVGVAQVGGGDQEGPPGDFRNRSFHGSSFYYTAALTRLQPPLTTPRWWTILERCGERGQEEALWNAYIQQ